MNPTTSGYQQILVATDFSPHAAAALQQALWLSRKTGASITLAHTLPDLRRVVHGASTQAKLDLLYGEGDAFQREVRRSSDAQLQKLIADLGAGDLDVKFVTLLGEPYIELTHAVRSEGFDLVLTGTRGLAAWEQIFVGSTASGLIRKCPASVWIVKAEHAGPPRTVLAATDFSDVSLKAAAQGWWVAQQAGAAFHLLHVIDSMDVPEDVISKVPQGSTLRQEINDEAEARLETFLKSLGADRSQIQVHLSWGTPWRELKRLGQHVAADLMAIGTVGRSGIKGLLLGNTAEKALSACDCSILTVKPDGFESPVPPATWPQQPGN